MIHVVFHYTDGSSTYAFKRVKVTPGFVEFNDDEDLHLRLGAVDYKWTASPKLEKYVGRLITGVTGVSIK